MAASMNYDFPGNVRELENAIEHAFVICAGDTIRLDDLPPQLVATAASQPPLADGRTRPLEDAEAEVIRNALARNHGNYKLTAAELGVSRNTLWRKIKHYKIDD